MREYLTGADLFSVLLLLRSSWQGTLLVTEGTTDARLLNSFIDREECQTVPGYGKEKVQEAIEIADQRRAAGVLGIVDADFENLDGRQLSSPNLLITDHHDFLVMIISSAAFDKFVNNWGNQEKIREFLQDTGQADLREAILIRGLPLGLFRRYSQQRSLNLTFEEVRLQGFVNRDDLSTDVENMVGRVLQRSEVSLIRRDDIVSDIIEELGRDHDVLQVCNGHDLMEIIAIGLRKTLGNLTGAESLSPAQLEAVMRTAYELADFEKTSLYEEIRHWEASNVPFLVLIS